MSIKSKLLEAVGEVNIEDIGTEALVDILVSRIKAQDAEIRSLHGENARERQRLHDEMESLRSEQHKMRTEPLYCAGAYYFFKGLGADLIRLEVQGYSIRGYTHRKNMDYPLQHISHEQYNQLENLK